MRKVLFVCALAMFGSLGLMAQEAAPAKKCAKSSAACCAKKTAMAKADDTKVLSMAESLAAQDENITKRVCAESGATSFYKKNVCSTSGKISYQEVEYDASNNQFVNKSPNDIGDANAASVVKTVSMEKVPAAEKPAAEMTKKACAKGAKKACCAKKKVGTEE